ncbi:hypothetical protein I6N96_06150 [Enterococcus sp. BWM-S5]|uniref:HEAT repeat domain-containing protein n=1 Tax=Enterococcus larvae TaxID=2794352 RepID=A0ABS4CGV9_9ENTE|nr:hypothetical protein [Enterococcus larvae]MBP1045856.1 hypothetical protein [Enterococcus larvae]
MVLEKLAVSQNRKDEAPNIELAELLVAQEDTEGIQELIEGLQMKKGIANDCIKVLYEIGERNPLLISDHVDVFLESLTSRNNRIVWGAMTALVTITEYKADKIYKQIDKVKYAYTNGSVITVDNSISVFAKLCKADRRYEKELFPFLMTHLGTCRSKEVPQHAERISICLNEENKTSFQRVLNERKPDLSSAQMKRVDKLMKDLAIL